MPETAGSQEHQRQLPPPPILHITDIPPESLANVASFLPKIPRALFAVAMTAPSSTWRESNWRQPASSTSRAILSLLLSQNQEHGRDDRGEEWAVLDFADIERSLATVLTDDDVGAILVCIKAATRLRSLKLTGCINLIGYGLEPLSGSTILEKIDLSLVGKHESPNIPKPSLKKKVVLPILLSIIDADGNSLRHIQLPKRFRSHRSRHLEDFMEEYGDHMDRNYGGTCSVCSDGEWGGRDGSGTGWIDGKRGSQFYGLQNFTCYECTANFCYDCLVHCFKCEKRFCEGCIPSTACAKKDCSNKICNGCGLNQCEVCGESACNSCCYLRVCCNKTMCTACVPSYKCEYGCGNMHCSDCFDYTTGNDIEHCSGCGLRSCSHCRFLEYRRNPDNTCENCVGILQGVQSWHIQNGRPFIKLEVTKIKPNSV